MATISKQDEVPQTPPTFHVDFGGMNWAFVDPRTGEPPVEEYAVGELVLLLFRMQATDERVFFYLDGEEVQPTYYNEQYGYCIDFIMPAHDVRVQWRTQNIMGKIEVLPNERGNDEK